MDGLLQGRVIVVTGASGALGEAVAQALVHAGARLHLPLRRGSPALSELAAQSGGRAIDGIDLADEAAVEGFYGEIDGLWASLHCAGGWAAMSIEGAHRSDLDAMLAMNLTSVVLCCRAAVLAMRRHGGGGRIVNVAALPALEPRRGAGSLAYTISKAGVAAFTQALGEEVAGEGILVNAIAPSTMDTPVNRRAMPSADHTKWAKLDEVAATIGFLASPENRVTRSAVVPVYGRG